MKTILVIDDEPNLRQTLIETLHFMGYTTLEAADGATGLALAATHYPDLIIADVIMPGLDGYEFLEEMRQNPRTRTIPIILLSAVAEYQAMQRGLRLGACQYVSKPFAVEELLSAVQTVTWASTA